MLPADMYVSRGARHDCFFNLLVQVMPEYFWAEADWSHDVRIANNYIEGPYGGILVGLIRLFEQGSGQFMNHR